MYIYIHIASAQRDIAVFFTVLVVAFASCGLNSTICNNFSPPAAQLRYS